VTFSANYNPTATEFTVSNPGAATPFTFNNLTFNTIPTSGYYLSAIDTTDDSNTFVVNMVNPTPITTNKTLMQGGASIVWPYGFTGALVSPSSADLGGGTFVVINNPAANYVSGPATVQFGNTMGSGATIVSPTQIAVYTPPHATGTVDVTVTVNGTPQTLTGAFTFNSSSVGNLFAAGPHLNAERFHPAAAVLTDGRVLLTGGQDTEDNIQSTTEIEASNTFTVGPSMAKSRAEHTATTLADGRVLIVGGYVLRTLGFGTATDSSTEIYDPVQNLFLSGPPLTTPRANHTATLLPDGRVLVVGGENSAGDFAVVDTAEVFDPVANSWTTIGMNSAREFHQAVLMRDGKVLVTGGNTGDGASSSAEVFDPATNTFTLLAQTMNEVRQEHGAVLLSDGRVFIVGGVDGNVGTQSQTAEIFDESTFTFTLVNGTLPKDVDSPVIALLGDGKVLIASGDECSGDGCPSDSATIFDPTNNANPFVDISPMTEPREKPVGVRLPNGAVLIMGSGENDSFSSEMFGITAIPVINTIYPTSYVVNSGGLNLAILGSAFSASSQVVLSAGGPQVQLVPSTITANAITVDVSDNVINTLLNGSLVPLQVQVSIVDPLGYTITSVISDSTFVNVQSEGSTTSPNVDLGVSSVQVIPTVVAPGQTVQVTSLIQNTGAMASGPFTYGYYLNADGTLPADASGYLDTESYTTGLNSLQVAGLYNGSVTIPSSLAPGTYYFGVNLDINNSVNDTITTNNHLVTPIVVLSAGGLPNIGLADSWNFDESSGPALDPIGSVSGSLIGDATRVPHSGSGNAISLPGLSDPTPSYVDFGTGVGQFGTSTFGIQLSFNTSSTAALSELLSNRVDGSLGNYFSLRIDATGKLTYELSQDGNGTNYGRIDSTSGFNDGNWHTVTVGRQGVLMWLAIDGQLQGTFTTTDVTNISNGQHLELGTGPYRLLNGGGFYDGLFDDLLIYTVSP
jgi:hypothetical protein